MVEASRLASLRRWHASLRELLQETPVALVDDWQRPRRAMRRTEIADLQDELWQIWADSRHQALFVRTPRDDTRRVSFARDDAGWSTIRALLEAPNQRLTWKRLQLALELEDLAETENRVANLQRAVGEETKLIRQNSKGCALGLPRFVHLLPPPDLPLHHQKLLCLLADHPGTAGQELAEVLQSPLRTVQRHLQQLRQAGLALIVGGGRDARYWAI
jgi:hypothetical protein